LSSSSPKQKACLTLPQCVLASGGARNFKKLDAARASIARRRTRLPAPGFEVRSDSDIFRCSPLLLLPPCTVSFVLVVVCLLVSSTIPPAPQLPLLALRRPS
jgi:hypothetical protein